jgi:CubicO group peptidase (beta-lactamase class C family)
MQRLDAFLNASLGTVFTAASVEVRLRGSTVYRTALGSLDPDGALTGDYPRVGRETLFDYASLTKLFTTIAFFRLVDAGRVALDTPVVDILPEFTGQRPIRPYDHPLQLGELVEVVPPTDMLIDASTITFHHLLTHSSGLPAWINLRKADDVPSRMALCYTTPFAYPPSTTVIYSDVGLILLGEAIARLTDATLNTALRRLVTVPLDLHARYGPIREAVGQMPPTEFCQWRGRRVVGEVHDENAATLGGVAGHAGLFGTAADVATLAQLYLADGGGFISSRLAREATRRQIGDRGLGWMLRSAEGSSSGHHFSADSFGHTGFVGNSVWVDPVRHLISVVLTNNVFFGRQKDAITQFRVEFHDALIQALASD